MVLTIVTSAFVIGWPPQSSLAVMVAQSMAPPHDPHYTADWAAALEKDNVRRQQNEASSSIAVARIDGGVFAGRISIIAGALPPIVTVPLLGLRDPR
jgi:hypothetical protein